MGFRQEIDEQNKQKESLEKLKTYKVQEIKDFCVRHNLSLSDEEINKILHPENLVSQGNIKEKRDR